MRHSLHFLVLISLIESIGNLSGAEAAITIFDFQFDDPSGTNLVSAADGSGNGYSFAGSDYAGLETNGSGLLVFQPVVSVGNGLFGATRATRSFELSAADQITSSQNAQARFAMVIAPWNFSSPNGNDVSFQFGFGSGSATNVAAQFTLSRPINDNPSNQVFLGTSALGTGATSKPAEAVFDAVLSESVTIFIDLDKAQDLYSVSYQVGGGSEQVFFSGTTDSARDGRFIRFTHGGSGENRLVEPNSFAIDRITLTAVPEPTSAALLIFAGIACVCHRLRPSSPASGTE